MHALKRAVVALAVAIAAGTPGVAPAREGPAPAIATLHTRPIPGGHAVHARNTLAGPVGVVLHLVHARNVHAQPALPRRAMLPARGTALLATLGAADPMQDMDFELSMDAVPGDPRARPRDVEYRYPLQRAPVRVDQGFAGGFSHADAENRHAVDFAAPLGTPVLAAREGIVMAVVDHHPRGVPHANEVRLLHPDGAMTVYAHLAPRSARVAAGDAVRSGDVLALSGDTGFTTGPHLHFAVQANRDMRLESIRFRMSGPDGPLRLQGF